MVILKKYPLPFDFKIIDNKQLINSFVLRIYL